jgi:hypothetical protein
MQGPFDPLRLVSVLLIVPLCGTNPFAHGCTVGSGNCIDAYYDKPGFGTSAIAALRWWVTKAKS